MKLNQEQALALFNSYWDTGLPVWLGMLRQGWIEEQSLTVEGGVDQFCNNLEGVVALVLRVDPARNTHVTKLLDVQPLISRGQTFLKVMFATQLMLV
ncbi:MAG: hypothetical protein H6765_06680 [Candidatus Peribacteria bacterium]|nr:MAG: hypothetical protein H6765_06680 [Candidatus Peribacteria bacterium]